MMMIFPIPALDDNYIWLLQENDSLVIIDPSESAPVMNWLAEHQQKPSAIWVTHLHHDHIGGVAELMAHYPNLKLYAFSPIAGAKVTQLVGAGDRIPFGRDSTAEVLDLSGHTPDHLGYYLPTQEVLFCGDALFSGGCGRLFNGGTAEQMTASLARIAQLPVNTLLYPAHEYTLANLRFADRVEPDNADLIAHLSAVQRLRQEGKMTLPTSLTTELAINPFLRIAVPQVRHAIESWAKQPIADPVSLFAQLRAWKDSLDRTGVLELPA
jgi:hydroxyacylglutathione hydrolase